MTSAQRRVTRRAGQVAAAILGLLASGLADEPAGPVPARQFIPAADGRFRYEGRFDLGNPSEPVVIWEGSRISLDFEGEVLSLRFASPVGQNFFNAGVDGANVL